MAIEISEEKRRAELPEHLRHRPKTDPERMRFEKGWKAGEITWLDPEESKVELFQKPKKPLFYLFLGFFFLLLAACAFGLQYYAETVSTLQHEIKDTLAKKGYYRNDPVFKDKFDEMEKIILITTLRSLLSYAQSLPMKKEASGVEFTPDNSYLAYIKAHNLPFETNSAVKWMIGQYR